MTDTHQLGSNWLQIFSCMTWGLALHVLFRLCNTEPQLGLLKHNTLCCLTYKKKKNNPHTGKVGKTKKDKYLLKKYYIPELSGTGKKGTAKRGKLQHLVSEMHKDVNVCQQLPAQKKEVMVFVFAKSPHSPKICFILSQKEEVLL